MVSRARSKPDSSSGPIVVGVDGCKGGWFAVSRDLSSGRIQAKLFPRFEGIMNEWMPVIIAVDIPVGLSSDEKPRGCDKQARATLGARGVSVFSAPNRQALTASDYADACARNRAATANAQAPENGRAISQQAFHLIKKIKEVDAFVRDVAHARIRIFEVHPELSFMALRNQYQAQEAGGLALSKHAPQGRAVRLALLQQAFGGDVDHVLDDRTVRTSRQASRDDLLDAFAALWSAQRIHDQSAIALRDTLARDEHGIEMAIHY